MWLSIFLASLYFRSSLLSTRIRLIQMTFSGIRALAVPFLLPCPLCRPFFLASSALRTRARLWIIVGFLMIKPSLTSLRIFWPKNAKEMNHLLLHLIRYLHSLSKLLKIHANKLCCFSDKVFMVKEKYCYKVKTRH